MLTFDTMGDEMKTRFQHPGRRKPVNASVHLRLRRRM
jgi:hypothetical protein